MPADLLAALGASNVRPVEGVQAALDAEVDTMLDESNPVA
jgi:hypothetical protein